MASAHLIDGDYSPLEALALRALARFGEMSVASTEADALLLFIDFANEIIDDIAIHPYTVKGTTPRYYTHVAEARPIPDHVMVAGLLAKYATQQRSAMAGDYLGTYYLRLNQSLAIGRFGDGAGFELGQLDGYDGGVIK